MFICYVLELLRWSGDRQTLALYWPTVKRAAEWQMNVSAAYGVPLKLQTTYAIPILSHSHHQLMSLSPIKVVTTNLSSIFCDSCGPTSYSISLKYH